MVGNISLRCESSAAALRRGAGARRELQRARSRRCRRFDRCGAPRPGFFACEEAVSAQRHVPCHLLASREHAAAARRDPRSAVSVVRGVGKRAHRAVSRVRREEAGEPGARLRRFAAVLARYDVRCPAGRGNRRAVRSHPRRRVSGHERAASRHPEAAAAERLRRHRRGRRCAGDLFVSRGHGREHPGVSKTIFRGKRIGRDYRDAGRKLPLHARRLECRQCADR